ncbi:MAG: right-handed parallel beta-helix repeat-containing protein [Armatimonadetes bacterium]|nr:right-handed parallel beta-helix repeat-containing protein [Armatimonadota bacterium]
MNAASALWLVGLLTPAILLALTVPAGAEESPGKALPSVSPVLEQAAEALADKRFEAARAGFDAAAKESALPFVRSLALLGSAEAEMGLKNVSGAVAVWKRLAADAGLPQLHRDIALRLIDETNRIRKGKPGRDPAAYRVQLPRLPRPAATFHVAPGGNGNGTASRPFGSLDEARMAIRALKEKHGDRLPKGGVRVVAHGGVYPVRQTTALTEEDSGTAQAPVVYQGKAGEKAVFDGGLRLTGWQPIADASLKEKLDPSARDRVLELDLKALGISDFGDAADLRMRPELFLNGQPQTLARWPNEGFVRTGELLGKEIFTIWNTIPACSDGKFRYAEERPSLWLDEPDVRLYGYWCWDWYEEYQKVAAIDPKEKSFTIEPPYSQYGYRKDQRYYAVNLFCEIDRPGEWYLSRSAGKLYWLPPEGFDAGKDVTTLSVFSQPFLTLDNAEHVIVQGLAFRQGRGDGITISGGSDCLVAGCTLRQLGGDAIVIRGGERHGVFGCLMKTLGCGGARVAGGDLKTLTPGHHFVENCTIFDISRLKRTYAPAVHFDGCGNRIAHNHFEHIPSSAMRIEGNDHLIELNSVRDVVYESDDQGGVDMFGNPLYRGVAFRWNRFADITGGTHTGAAGIRLDDMISGIAVYANLFERCGSALFGGVQIHGGKDNLVDNNLFLDCYAGMSFSRWVESGWLGGIEKFLAQASAPPYSTRYPDLSRLKIEANINNIARNAFARCKELFLRDGGVERTALNAVTDRTPDPSARQDPTLRSILFDPIPVDEIGPYAHPWRAADEEK